MPVGFLSVSQFLFCVIRFGLILLPELVSANYHPSINYAIYPSDYLTETSRQIIIFTGSVLLWGFGLVGLVLGLVRAWVVFFILLIAV